MGFLDDTCEVCLPFQHWPPNRPTSATATTRFSSGGGDAWCRGRLRTPAVAGSRIARRGTLEGELDRTGGARSRWGRSRAELPGKVATNSSKNIKNRFKKQT